MNRTQLNEQVAANLGLTAAEVDAVTTATYNTILTTAAGGERVVITGFGRFDAPMEPERTYRNPQTETGEAVTTPPRRRLRFRAAERVQDALTRGEVVIDSRKRYGARS